ncbi:discoidin domain-containing protein, partial [Haloferula sp.]|uniref:discoidin domain-containing protein n=1 Tax=Haloferula sp. TaxID=2497595 RepID=UPI003C75BD76
MGEIIKVLKPMSRLTLSLTLILVVLLASISQGSSVEDLQQAFQKRCDEVITKRDQQIDTLRDNYQAALERLFEKTKAKGKLELLIPIKDQMDALEAGRESLPGLPSNAAYNVKQLRDTFDQAEGKILKTSALELTELATKMEQALGAKQTELTKAGEIEDALRAKKVRGDLNSNEELAAARNYLSRLSSDGKILRGKIVKGDIALKSRGVTVTGMEEGDRMIDGESEKHDLHQGWALGRWPCVAEVDLKDVYAVEKVRILLYDKDERNYKYKIEGSENREQWLVLADRSRKFTNTGWQESSMEPMDLRYIRIHGVENDTNWGFHIVELVVECVGGGHK